MEDTEKESQVEITGFPILFYGVKLGMAYTFPDGGVMLVSGNPAISQKMFNIPALTNMIEEKRKLGKVTSLNIELNVSVVPNQED